MNARPSYARDAEPETMSQPRRIVAIIQARTTSERLPGKVLMPLAGKPALERMVERIKRIPSVDHIVIATTTNDSDMVLTDLANRLNVGWHRGSEMDVLSRVLGAARAHDADIIVEFTGDCPLVDADVSERCIQNFLEGGADFVSNGLKPSYPLGTECNVFATATLADVAERTQDPLYREHVSLYMIRHPELYRHRPVQAPPELTAPDVHLTLDEMDDYRLISAIYDRIYPGKPDFTMADVLALLEEKPELRELNRHVKRRTV